jgi:hypothetical protein
MTRAAARRSGVRAPRLIGLLSGVLLLTSGSPAQAEDPFVPEVNEPGSIAAPAFTIAMMVLCTALPEYGFTFNGREHHH